MTNPLLTAARLERVSRIEMAKGAAGSQQLIGGHELRGRVRPQGHAEKE